MFQTASFGVLAAFVLFFALFGRMLWRTLSAAIKAYQDRVQDRRDEAESLLREAKDLLKRAQDEAKALSQQLVAIRKNTAEQIAHMDKQEAQMRIVLKAQAVEKADADIRRVRAALSKKLLTRTLSETITEIQKTLIKNPKGTSTLKTKTLDTFFEVNQGP